MMTRKRFEDTWHPHRVTYRHAQILTKTRVGGVIELRYIRFRLNS